MQAGGLHRADGVLDQAAWGDRGYGHDCEALSRARDNMLIIVRGWS